MIKKLASYLSKYPHLKRTVKYTFQAVMFGFSYHRTRFFCKFKVNRLTDEDGGFFGYYDKSPESPDGKHVIYHVPNMINGKLNYSEVNIVLIKKQGGERSIVTTSTATNLQVGSRLQWLDNNRFIFNYYDELSDKYLSGIYFIDEAKIVLAGPAIYDTTPDKYITLSFKNLADVGSEYGYLAHNTSHDEVPVIMYGGFYQAKAQIVIELDDIKRIYPKAFEIAKHYHFNHLMFSPSANAFIFIFRWTGSSGRSEILIHYNLITKELIVLNDEMSSHCCWVDERTVFGFMKHKGVEGYYFISLQDKSFTKMVVNSVLKDGHPTVRAGVVLSDTYPDNRRMQHIYLVDKGVVLEIGSFFSPLRFHEKDRCDLHPRFNYLGNRIYFDSMHGGKRHLYRIKFGDDE